LLSANKIEQQIQFLKDSPTSVAVCNYVQFFGEGEPPADLQFPDQSSFIYTSNDPLAFLVNLWGGKGESNFIQTNSWLVPMSLIEKAGGWRAYRCPDDDGEFFARVVLVSEGIVYVPGVMNYYHVSLSESRLSRSRVKKYLQNTLLTIDLKHQYLKAKGIHPAMNKAIAIQYLRFAVDNYPAQKLLSMIAYKRYKELEEKAPLPVFGGKVIEWIKKIFGWRVARILRYYTREL
jgi:GT2 family glycosyltransferase